MNGEGQSQQVTVIVNDAVTNPTTNNVIVNEGESAILNANGTEILFGKMQMMI